MTKLRFACPYRFWLAEDLTTNQEVRWCPGCGDFSILAQLKQVLASLDTPRENLVFISGIGCAGRLPYYLNTYGFHGIQGRAPALATGLKVANPNLAGVGRHRRRRWAVRRHQSPDSRLAPQCRYQDPAFQQRSLRPVQRPIFADMPVSAPAPNPARKAPSIIPCGLCRWLSAPRPPSWRAPSTSMSRT